MIIWLWILFLAGAAASLNGLIGYFRTQENSEDEFVMQRWLLVGFPFFIGAGSMLVIFSQF